MSEGGEKTEPPSPKKIRDARQKGQVARSQEVVTSISLMAVIAVVWVQWGSITQRLVRMLDVVAVLATGDLRLGMSEAIDVVFHESVAILMPILGVAIFAAVAANYAQIGTIFALDSVMPKLDKISPASGFKKIFSMKSVIEILKSVSKIVFLSVLLFFVLKNAIGVYIVSLPCGLACMSNVTTHTMLALFAYSALAFIIVALADFAYQRHSYTKGLMMSKDEVKREYKESEGDPHIKGHRKQLAHELLMSEGGHGAKKASAVIVNPTHFAVGIRYIPREMPLPAIVAKGRNAVAHEIRATAEQLGIPVFLNVPLARALYADVGLDGYVPEELFEAIAEVLAWVEKNRDLLYKGPLGHGVLDMERGDHRTTKPD